MSATTAADAAPFAISHVENFNKWFKVVGGPSRPSVVDGQISLSVRLHALLPNAQCPQGFEMSLRYLPYAENNYVAVVRHLYDKNIGHVGCIWASEGVPIEYKHAKVRFGDLFDFYTSPNGVLRLPDWCSMRFAVEQYLEEDPRIKFHPSRVREFIQEHGVEELEMME